MIDRADVRSFQSLEALRIALVKFAHAATSAVESAEGEGNATLTWLEGTQTGYWKAEVRKARERSEKAKDTYRQKVYFTDGTGARQSAIEEMIEMRRAAERVSLCEDKIRTVARHKPKLRREVDQFRGGTGRLKGMLDRELPVTLARLRLAVQRLEEYAAAHADVSPTYHDAEPTMSMAAPGDEPEPTEDALPETSVLRARTPKPQLRQKADRVSMPPRLPDVSAEAREVASRLFDDDEPGRYDIVTLSITGEEPAVYLERLTPANDTDTGWHVGAATPEPTGNPVTAVTVGKFRSVAPHLVELLRLPVGCCVVARGGDVCRIVDALGRIIWEDSDGNR